MEQLETIEANVKSVLEQDEDARNDDMTLYLRVCDVYVKDMGDVPFATVMLQYKLFGLPNFESVSRIRRKLQKQNPELLGSTRIQKQRTRQEQLYRKYAGVPIERPE